jgi:hypothetical protein
MQILSRPHSDPFLVDIASYTDYYRLRASVFAASAMPALAVRYDFPAPHAPGSHDFADTAFSTLGCNGGMPVPLNPISYAAYARALLIGLAGDPGVLPQSRVFELGPAPEPSPYFNALPGVTLQVPFVDDNAQPRGGVRFPDVELPLGRAEPPAMRPCQTSSITATCGNFGGWQAFSAHELQRRYGTLDHYIERYATIVEGLVGEGFVLERDRGELIAQARGLYQRAR